MYYVHCNANIICYYFLIKRLMDLWLEKDRYNIVDKHPEGLGILVYVSLSVTPAVTV